MSEPNPPRAAQPPPPHLQPPPLFVQLAQNAMAVSRQMRGMVSQTSETQMIALLAEIVARQAVEIQRILESGQDEPPRG